MRPFLSPTGMYDCMDAGGRVPTVGALSDSGSSYRGVRSGDTC